MDIIRNVFNSLVIRINKLTIYKSEKRIKKLESKIAIEKSYYKYLLREAIKFCKDVSKN